MPPSMPSPHNKDTRAARARRAAVGGSGWPGVRLGLAADPTHDGCVSCARIDDAARGGSRPRLRPLIAATAVAAAATAARAAAGPGPDPEFDGAGAGPGGRARQWPRPAAQGYVQGSSAGFCCRVLCARGHRGQPHGAAKRGRPGRSTNQLEHHRRGPEVCGAAAFALSSLHRAARMGSAADKLDAVGRSVPRCVQAAAGHGGCEVTARAGVGADRRGVAGSRLRAIH
eukprot:359459-Chlamydomonas_euryale.AAC.5